MLIFPVLPETLLIFMPLLLIVLYQMLLKLTLELKRSLHKLSRQNQTRLCRILPTFEQASLRSASQTLPQISSDVHIWCSTLGNGSSVDFFFFFPGQSYI